MTDLEKLNWLCKGNTDAIQFCAMIVDMVAVYDDVIDKDNENHTDLAVHSMMHNALFGLPYNKFYQANFALLNPLLMNSIANWRIANELEAMSKTVKDDGTNYSYEDLSISFIIRSSYADILRMVAFITGGDAHSIQAGIEIRRYVHAEGLAAYLTEQQGE